eukprot:688568-Pleurochrysis_carterae.AAC.4
MVRSWQKQPLPKLSNFCRYTPGACTVRKDGTIQHLLRELWCNKALVGFPRLGLGALDGRLFCLLKDKRSEFRNGGPDEVQVQAVITGVLGKALDEL